MDDLLNKLINVNFDLYKLIEEEGFTLSEFYDICKNNPELIDKFNNETVVIAKFQIDLLILNNAITSGCKDSFNSAKLLIDKILKRTVDKVQEDLLVEMPTEDGEFVKVKL